MPKIYEVYGRDSSDESRDAINERRAAYCPYTESECDGGGNRHQTKIRLENSELRSIFSRELNSIVPGICSIEYGGDAWIVCPRRLLGFDSKINGIPEVNYSLKEHEKQALIEAGLPQNKELGVWPEVYLQFSVDDTFINYHLDFVIAPIRRNKSFRWLFDSYDVNAQEDIDFLSAAAKTGKYFSGRFDLDKCLPVVPDLVEPVIVEVMTASTSGSDTEAGTNISSAFTDLIAGREHNCPGINKRQVWGRMATQLFAKSALAKAWGGKTVWLVQDQLLRNIEQTTKLSLIDEKHPPGEETINFLSMSYRDGCKGLSALKFDRYVEKRSGLNFDGSGNAVDILLPKVNPDRIQLLKAVLRRRMSAIISL